MPNDAFDQVFSTVSGTIKYIVIVQIMAVLLITGALLFGAKVVLDRVYPPPPAVSATVPPPAALSAPLPQAPTD